MPNLSDRQHLRERYALGDKLLLDVGRQRLERDGSEVPLPKLSFEFLVALVRAAPNVVTYDELMARVWPGLVVQAETVSQRAKLLRDALEDDPQAPRFIRGVRGRGYVLACAVQLCEPDEPIKAPRGAPSESPRTSSHPPGVSSRRFDKPVTIAVAGLLAIITAAGTLVSLRDAGLAGAPSHVVAVAPFQAVTGEPRDVALAHGIGEAVHTRLISRKDLPASGGDLSPPLDTPLLGRIAWPNGSHYLLKAALQRIDERLRITAQLVDTRNEELIHSFILEADTRDLLRLEDDIAQHAARAIHVELEARAAMQRPDAGTRNADARLAFERGRARYQRWRIDDGETAIVHFKRSVALDPNYARAYVWQAMAQFRNAVLYKHQDAQLEMQAVRPLFERAFAIAPNLGEAHAAPAFFDTSLTPEAVEARIRHGLALDPQSAEIYSMLAQAIFHSQFGRDHRRQEQLDAIDQAIALAPHTTRYLYLKALILHENPATAAQGGELMLTSLEADPDFASGAQRLAHWRWTSSQPADAIRWSEHAIRIDPQTGWHQNLLCLMYLELSDPAAAREVSDAAEAAAVAPCRASLALYEGDWRHAAQLAFDLSPVGIASWYYDVGLVGALSRYASETGDAERVLSLLREAHGDRFDQINPDRAFLLLQLYEMHGDRIAKQRLLDDLWRDLPETERRHSANELYPTRASLLAWSGRDDEALDELVRWTRNAHSPFWWYVFEHDPTWQRLRHDPRFAQAEAQERAYVTHQQAMLATLRRQGVVPMRGDGRIVPGASTAALGR